MSKNKNIILESSAPLDDGGRKYNLIYPICGLGFGVVFLSMAGAGFAGFVFGFLLGLAIGWLIKNKICDIADHKFRQYTFKIENKKAYPELITALIPSLTPLGMTIETGTDGSPIVTYQGLIYDVTYNEDDTFSIWWQKNVARALFTINSIGEYRKISIAMGILGYNIQQICKQ